MMEQKNHESFSSAKSALNAILKVRYEGKMFKRNYGWAAAGLLLFFAAMWSGLLRQSSLATDGTSLWQIGVVSGSLLVAALLWLALHDTRPTGKCLLCADRRCRFRSRRHLRLARPRRGLEQRLVFAVVPSRCLPFRWCSRPSGGFRRRRRKAARSSITSPASNNISRSPSASGSIG